MFSVGLLTDKPGLPHQERHHAEPPRAARQHLHGSSEEGLQPDGEQLLSALYPLRPLQRTVQRRQEGAAPHPALGEPPGPSPLFTFVTVTRLMF